MSQASQTLGAPARQHAIQRYLALTYPLTLQQPFAIQLVSFRQPKSRSHKAMVSHNGVLDLVKHGGMSCWTLMAAIAVSAI